ncbi:molybdopterin molybdotransferase MoeA [bacterium]|nr:molybdopterin molybdotransferase MoeA [bacterium]
MEPISYSESLQILQKVIEKIRGTTETIPARQAVFRVLAGSVFAKRANPAIAVAAMDGIAVNSSTIPDALVRLRQEQWQFINTGDVVPEQFNSVIRIEDVQWEENVPVLDKKPNIYQNVRRPGEDFDKGTLLLLPNQQLQPQDISLLLAAGCDPVEVYKKPVVSFIPTGSELVHSYDTDQPGKILESNSAMIAGFVQTWGGEFHLMDLVPDEADDLAQTLKLSVHESDIVVISAGTSKGTKDVTADVIRIMGKIHFRGVKMTPGKPVILGEISGIPILGLPGYPAAAHVCSYLYLRPLVCELSHVHSSLPRSVFISSEEIPAKNHDYFYRVNCFDIEGQTYVRRTAGGSSSISSLSQMDGLMHIPPQTPIKKRDGVRIDVIQDRPQNTITARGVSDPGFLHLFAMLQRSVPSHRLLFWPSPAYEALQSIVERNVHIATLNTPAEGNDSFDSFSKQLQEPMHRYRAFTRTVGLTFREPGHQELTKGLKIAVPESELPLWNSSLDKRGISRDHFQIINHAANDKYLQEAFQLSRWDAVFADIRFLTEEHPPLFSVQEHLDFVIPESYIEMLPVRKLIELLLSEEFWMWIETQKGCDVAQRGLLE